MTREEKESEERGGGKRKKKKPRSQSRGEASRGAERTHRLEFLHRKVTATRQGHRAC